MSGTKGDNASMILSVALTLGVDECTFGWCVGLGLDVFVVGVIDSSAEMTLKTIKVAARKKEICLKIWHINDDCVVDDSVDATVSFCLSLGGENG